MLYSKIKIISVLTLIFILLFQIVEKRIIAQKVNDIEKFTHLFENKEEKPNYATHLKENSNELKQISSLLFIFYKEFFSSQDGNHCVFQPSCSVYTIEAVKKQGIVIGLMNGIDRLSRCNRLSPENYKMYKNTNLFYDPLD